MYAEILCNEFQLKVNIIEKCYVTSLNVNKRDPKNILLEVKEHFRLLLKSI